MTCWLLNSPLLCHSTGNRTYYLDLVTGTANLDKLLKRKEICESIINDVNVAKGRVRDDIKAW